MPVAGQDAFECRHLRVELSGVRVLRFLALCLGKGLLRLLQRSFLDRPPALRDRPSERLRVNLPVDRPGAPDSVEILGVELDNTPERCPLLVESSGAAGVFGFPALGQ